MPAGMSEQVAEEALRRALSDLCRGGSWRGVARGVAWRIVSAGGREPRSIELLADSAEAMLASLIDQALWSVERTVLETWDEFLAARPGDEEAALVAASLDAYEVSSRLVRSAPERVLESLLGLDQRAA